MTVMVNIKHARALNLCAKGMRPWFATQGLSWNDFIGEGISEDKLLATNNSVAARVVAEARKQSNG